MPALEDPIDDRGDPSEWAELDGEETRCLLGLKSYYTRIEDKDEILALGLAWVDLQREKPRLLKFKWFKQNSS